MGCASSAALPFLTSRGNQAAAESPKMNGQPPYELKMVNNKLKENGVTNAKDINESFVTDKMKEVVDSTGVHRIHEGVVGEVVRAKEEAIGQIKGLGESMSDKVTSIADGVEDAIESAFGKLTGTVESAEEKLKEDVESMEKDIKSAIKAEEEVSEMKAEDIDELLNSLPTEEEMAEAVKGKKEEEEKGEEEGEGN